MGGVPLTKDVLVPELKVAAEIELAAVLKRRTWKIAEY